MSPGKRVVAKSCLFHCAWTSSVPGHGIEELCASGVTE